MRWIIVDGIDGSGKTSVASWIERYYCGRGERVLVQMHPSDRFMGRNARRFLQGKGKLMYILSSLFFILDVLTSLRKLRRWRREYDDVVFVRYLMGTAYLPGKYAKMGYNLFRHILPVPEHLLLVDVQPDIALRRISERNDHEEMFENLPALTRVRETVLGLAEGWTVLDNSGSEERSVQRLHEVLAGWD